jgi:branched-subunit amino acid aminotransferase/4-amino-4-deoxychorismate lyase
MPEPIAYLNGRLVPQSQAQLPLHDAGFVQGATVTDLCRTFRGRLFRFKDHLARLRHSCNYARIPLAPFDEDLIHAADEVIGHNMDLLREGQDLALVLFATPGPLGYYAGLDEDGPPTLGMHTFPLPFARYARLFEEGARLVVPSTRQVPAVCVDPRVKQRSRLHWRLAEQEARLMDPQASALLLDITNHVTETARANFLAVHNGVVLSPPRSCILGGISLLTIAELCREINVPFEERPLTLYDCLTAEEAFLSSTPYCLVGVSQINGLALPWPGPIFQLLLAAWGTRVGLDIQRQILSNP